MPYKSEKIKLNEKQDRRRKLTTLQIEEIKEMYASGKYSMNQLAKIYEVSKKTILLKVNEESFEKSRKYHKENWKQFQQDTETRNAHVRKHRKYKQELYLKGELKE